MKYPKAVKEKMKQLDMYKFVYDLKEFNIIHMYPKGLAYPNGYTDCRNFEVIIFNTTTLEKTQISGLHDGIRIGENISIKSLLIYADGSYYASFYNMVVFPTITQCLYIEKV